MCSSPTRWTRAAIFRERGIDVDEKPGLSPDELKAIIGEYDGLAVRSSTKVNAAAMDAALPRLKVIGRAGIGVDTIDVPAASARGIVVMNTPFGNSITTAEHAIAMLFALAREIPQADQSTQSGKWEKNRFMGVELAGKTLGLIGCGNIGSIVADRAHGLKMKVVAYDPFLSPRPRGRAWRRQGRAGRASRPRRLHHAAYAADRPDPRHPQPRGAGEDEAGRAHRQLRARRADRRSGAEGGARQRPYRRRRARRVRRGAGQGQCAVRHARPHLHAAPRRLDHRGAGQCRDPDRRADERLPAARRNHQRSERAVALGRGSAAAQALHGARGKARAAGRPDRRRPKSARSTSRSKAPRPSSTSSRSPARCSRGSCAPGRTR